MWLIEKGLKEYLVLPQEEGGVSADGCWAPGLECVNSPLVQRLLAKAKAKEGDEIEPQSMDNGQCPYAPARGWRGTRRLARSVLGVRGVAWRPCHCRADARRSCGVHVQTRPRGDLQAQGAG